MPCVSGVSAFEVASTFSVPLSLASQAQPLPNWPVAALPSSASNAARVPKSRVIAAIIAAEGALPPGVRLCQ